MNERIAILRALQLGDMLCAVPVFRAVRVAHPHAQITLIGLPWARSFAERLSGYLDDFIEFPGFPGLPERAVVPEDVVRFLHAAQARRFDLVLQLHGSGSHINECVQLLGARRSAGFHDAGDVIPDPIRFIPWPVKGTETHRLMRILDAIGVEAQGDTTEFPVTDTDRAELRASHEVARLEGRTYCIVHPGARFPSRRWSPARFAAVADALAAEGMVVVLTGVADEAPVVAEVRALMRTSCVDLTGRLSLGALAALLDGARLVISNDTGISHLASAVGAPSVVIASGSDVERWAPADPWRHLVLWHEVGCRPCMHRECPFGHECAAGVSVDDVMDAAFAVLQRAGGLQHVA